MEPFSLNSGSTFWTNVKQEDRIVLHTRLIWSTMSIRASPTQNQLTSAVLSRPVPCFGFDVNCPDLLPRTAKNTFAICKCLQVLPISTYKFMKKTGTLAIFGGIIFSIPLQSYIPSSSFSSKARQVPSRNPWNPWLHSQWFPFVNKKPYTAICPRTAFTVGRRVRPPQNPAGPQAPSFYATQIEGAVYEIFQ